MVNHNAHNASLDGLSLILRPAKDSDAESVSRLVLSLAPYFQSKSDLELPKWFTDNVLPSAFRKRFIDDQLVNLVCCDGRDLVGYAGLNRTGHIFHLFVNEQAQGQGIARRLWHAAKKEVAVMRYTVRSSLFAVPVYETFGFEISEPVGERDGIKFQPMVLNVGK